MTRTLVVGFGSIGARHARILEAMGHSVAVVSRRDIQDRRCFPTIAKGLAIDPDYVVLASRTFEHGKDLEALAAAGFRGRVLVEKPMLGALGQIPEGFADVRVGFNLRFHPAVLALRDRLRGSRVLSVQARAGQYLPDWRPDTDYRIGASARTSDGGGVIRDLSHEIDLIAWLFGPWLRLCAIGGTFSNLEIESDDLFALLGATRDCPAVSLQLNYLDHPAQRFLIALTDSGTWRLDLITGRVEGPEIDDVFAVERDDTYRAQHAASLAGDGEGCSVDEGAHVDAVIAAAEMAAREQRWVRP